MHNIKVIIIICGLVLWNCNSKQKKTISKERSLIKKELTTDCKSNQISFIDSNKVSAEYMHFAKPHKNLKGVLPFYLFKSRNSIKNYSKTSGGFDSWFTHPNMEASPSLVSEKHNVIMNNIGGYKAIFPTSGNYFLFLVMTSEGETEKFDYVTYNLKSELIDQVTARYSKAWGSDYPFDVVQSVLTENLKLEKYKIEFNINSDKPVYPWDVMDNNLPVKLIRELYVINEDGNFTLKEVQSKNLTILGDDLYKEKDLKYFFEN